MSVPAALLPSFNKMAPDSQAAFLAQWKAREKNNGIAYLLWFCFGWHYAYVGKWGMQVLFWLTFGGMMIWAFVDLFRIPGVIQTWNEDAARELLVQTKALESRRPPA